MTLSHSLGRDQKASEGLMRPIDPIILAVWFGMLTGVGEVAILAYRKFYQGRLLFQPAEVVWMCPLADVAIFACCGLILAAAAWRAPAAISLRLVIFVYLTIAVLFLSLRFPSIHSFASVILSLGVSLQLSKLIVARPALLQTMIGISTCWLNVLPLRRIWRGNLPVDEKSQQFALYDRRSVMLGAGLGLSGLMVGMHGRRVLAQRRVLSSLPPGRAAPNVLLLVLDTVRAENTSLQGYHRETTPELVKFARRGACFRRALSPSSWTLPSHATMFTGRYLHETKANMGGPWNSTFPTLAEVCCKFGYETAGFSANLWFVTREYGFQRGFSTFHDYRLTSPARILSTTAAGGKLLSETIARQLLLGEDNHPGRKTATMVSDELLDWILSRDQSRPFFAFANYYDAHAPYVPAKEFAGYFSDRVPDNPWVKPKRRLSPDSQELFALRDAYDRCIASVDSSIGKLLATLDKAGVLENTLVVITSDHGEHFGEHGLMDHINSLYMPLLHVPLIAVLPGRVPKETLIDHPVSLRDLPSTVMDLLGFDSEFPGKSWRPLWEGIKSDGPSSETPLLFEVNPTGKGHQPEWSPLAKGPMKSLVANNLQYIANGDGSEELYDFQADAIQEHDLAKSGVHKQTLDHFRRSLERIKSLRNE